MYISNPLQIEALSRYRQVISHLSNFADLAVRESPLWSPTQPPSPPYKIPTDLLTNSMG